MPIIGNVKQQPADVRDYDIDFSKWFPEGDVITSATISIFPLMVPPPSYAIKHPRIKVWMYAGGVIGTHYKITITARTNDGRVKEVELKIKIKDD